MMLEDALRSARHYRTEIVLFLASSTLHATFVGVIQLTSGAHGFISYSDAEFFFYRLAQNLLEHGAFSIMIESPYIADAYHTPLYPLFLAAFLAVGMPFWGIALVQGAIAALTVVLTYLIARSLTASHLLALGAGVVALVEPVALYWSGIFVSDTLFAFLFTAAIYALLCRRFFMLGIMLGLAALARPIALYLSPPFFVMGVYLTYVSARPLWHALRAPLMALALMALLVFPWFLHNKLTADTWAFTSAGWYDLGNPLQAYADEYGLRVPQLNPPPDPEPSVYNFEHSPFFRDTFVSLVRENPVGYALVHTKRVVSSIFSNRFDYLLDVVIRTEMPALYTALTPVGTTLFLAVGTVFWLSIYALVAIAAFNKDTRAWWLCMMIVVGANFAIAGAIHPHGGAMSRYILGIHALIFAFAAVGAQVLVRLPYSKIRKFVSVSLRRYHD